jgi:Restriction endonuclease
LERPKFNGESAAREDLETLETLRTKPGWLERQHALPFHELSPDEFEIFCYLLLCRENPDEDIWYYGKTGDAGRDIVWKKKDGTLELIQCKRYQQSVGSSKIQSELAKLYTNIHNQTIPNRPDIVTFYVVPDLTATAQDLINYSSKWNKIAKAALKAHLKKEPSKALLDFSLSWRPKFDKQIKVDLNTKASKYSDLRDEFFEFKKVIDEKLGIEILEQIKKTHELLLRPDIPNAPAALQEMLSKTEAENPGLAMNMYSTPKRNTIIFSAQPSVGEVSIGTLEFPDTEAGHRGEQKFESLIEEGRAIEFEDGEYEWKWSIDLSAISSSPSILSNLKIQFNIPEQRVPVRVDILQEQKVITSVSFAYLRILRAGTKEIEFLLEGGQLPGNFRQVQHLQDLKSTLTFNMSLCSIPAVQARNMMTFVLAFLQRNSNLRITLLEHEVILSEGGSVLETSDSLLVKEDFESIQKILDYIIKINQEFNLDLRYPEDLDLDTLANIESVVHAIECGQIKGPAGGTFSLTYQKKEALEFLELLYKEERFDIIEHYEDGCSISLLDHNLDMGKYERVFENVSSIEDVSLLKQLILEKSELDATEIHCSYESIVMKFYRWLPS